MNLKHSVTNLSPQNYDQLTHGALFSDLEPIQKNKENVITRKGLYITCIQNDMYLSSSFKIIY